ncbi:MAG TPA: PP2C family protein-serine/threonine phosphatase [Thermoanaerobaculia bacterium]|nr:PP2C family protein-serine/threonine phosphatase [Thermoanaerobaculia bacterium]
MKRFAPLAACLLGVIGLLLLLPRFDAPQPHGIELTRGEAEKIADQEARSLGIPVDRAWTNDTWVGSPLLDRVLDPDPARRRAAADDPAIGPRLGGYRITYYRRGLEKFPPYGYVYVGYKGEILSVRLRKRAEEAGAQPTEAQLRPRADAFVRSRTFAGAPNPQFESARPSLQRNRTDWIFRYRVPTKFNVDNVVPYLFIYFNGNEFAGWDLIEEYADGSVYRGDNSGEVAGTFGQLGGIYLMLLILIVMFLKKYHAGEVGVGTASFLFGTTLFLAIIFEITISAAASEGTGLGGIDAQQTALAVSGFKLLFMGLPTAVLVFLAWAVGESYARERWGERLASFDAILRRDPLNATVGRSVLNGVLTSPFVAACVLGVATIPILLGSAHPTIGDGTEMILSLGGPFVNLLNSASQAIAVTVVGILFLLAVAHRRRMLWAGILAAALLCMIGGVAEPPIEPFWQRTMFGFGGIGAIIGIFLAFDLLTATIALFFGCALTAALPLAMVAHGDLERQLVLSLAVPLILAVGFAVAALLTRREVVYTYEDLAPHVKRIVERERVKAEIDAANRIQAALLPLDAPSLAGASVASHYRAATEIGGDYFDFLPQPNGDIGIAFGDVSGHGLTSGIVMAMAKSALLVQVDYDPSPRAVLDVLNEIVIKTAPKRIMMTFFFGLLDSRAQSLRFSSAGHLDPYVYRAATQRIESLSSWGYPLGIRRREPFREHSVEFSAGDRLILYSDGLIEALDDDGEPFGFERFEATIVKSGAMKADDIKKAILNAVRKFTRNRPPEDDQTLVVVSFDEVASEPVLRPRDMDVLAVSDTVH